MKVLSVLLIALAPGPVLAGYSMDGKINLTENAAPGARPVEPASALMPLDSAVPGFGVEPALVAPAEAEPEKPASPEVLGAEVERAASPLGKSDLSGEDAAKAGRQIDRIVMGERTSDQNGAVDSGLSSQGSFAPVHPYSFYSYAFDEAVARAQSKGFSAKSVRFALATVSLRQTDPGWKFKFYFLDRKKGKPLPKQASYFSIEFARVPTHGVKQKDVALADEPDLAPSVRSTYYITEKFYEGVNIPLGAVLEPVDPYWFAPRRMPNPGSAVAEARKRLGADLDKISIALRREAPPGADPRSTDDDLWYEVDGPFNSMLIMNTQSGHVRVIQAKREDQAPAEPLLSKRAMGIIGGASFLAPYAAAHWTNPDAMIPVVCLALFAALFIGAMPAILALTAPDNAKAKLLRMSAKIFLGAAIAFIAAAGGIGAALLSSKLFGASAGVGGVMGAMKKVRVSTAEVRSIAEAYAKSKGGPQAESAWNEDCYYARIRLQEKGATEKQLELFDKILREAPVVRDWGNYYGT